MAVIRPRVTTPRRRVRPSRAITPVSPGAVQVYDAENGTLGVALTQASVPYTVAPTNGTGSSQDFDDTHAVDTLAYHYHAATGANCYGRVSYTPPSLAPSVRFSFYATTTGNRQIISLRSASAKLMSFVYDGDTLSWTDTLNANPVAMTEALPTGFYDVTAQLQVNGAAGSYVINVYNAGSTTPLNATPYTSTSYSLGTLPLDRGDLGVQDTVAGVMDLWLDEILYQPGQVEAIPPRSAPEVTSDIAFAGSSTLDVAPLVTESATVTLVGTSSLAVVPLVTGLATVPLASTSALTVTTTLTRTATVTFAGSSSLAVTPAIITHPATVALAGTSALTVTATVVLTPAVTLAGMSALAVGPLVTHLAAVAFAGSSSLGVSVVAQTTATVAFTSTSSVTVASTITGLATVTFAGSNTLAVTVARTIPATVTLISTSALSVTGTSAHTMAIALVGVNSLTITATATGNAANVFASTSALTVTAAVTRLAAVTFDGASLLTVAAIVARLSTVALAGTNVLTVTALTIGLNEKGSFVLVGTISAPTLDAKLTIEDMTAGLALPTLEGVLA